MGTVRKVVTTLVVLLALGGNAFATTWAETKARDPISGKNLAVHEPMSSGSYIYSWPGKEDQVFWPYTVDYWLWFSASSGFAAFGNDFESVAPESVPRLKQWLKVNYNPKKPPVTRIERLRWLEQLYFVRQMDQEFWCHFYRLMAFELRGDEGESLVYVRKALPLLQDRLKSSVEPMQRIETLYLLGEYNRRMGHFDVAREYFVQVRSAPYKDRDGIEHIGNPYFIELAAEREALIPTASPNNALERERGQ